MGFHNLSFKHKNVKYMLIMHHNFSSKNCLSTACNILHRLVYHNREMDLVLIDSQVFCAVGECQA